MLSKSPSSQVYNVSREIKLERRASRRRLDDGAHSLDGSRGRCVANTLDLDCQAAGALVLADQLGREITEYRQERYEISRDV